VRRSDAIAGHILAVAPRLDQLLRLVAEREARDAAPGDAQEMAAAETRTLEAWRERWAGLEGWFFRTGPHSGHGPPQAELLRSRARAAIPQLLAAIAALNERRAGRSDRSADFQVLAGWFAGCDSETELELTS